MEDTTNANVRIGRLQRAIIEALAERPRSVADLSQHLGAERTDNLRRSLAALAAAGRLVERNGLLRLEEHTWKGSRLRTSERMWRREYKALTQAFMLLSIGDPVGAEELFPPRRAGSEFGKRMLQRLQDAHVMEFVADNLFGVKDKRAMQDIWGHEAKFCALGEWSVTAAHIDDVQTLLSGGPLLRQASAAAALCESLGQENVYRRTGLSTVALKDLRNAAAVPASVVDALEQRGLGAAWLRDVDLEASAEALIGIMDPPAPPYREASNDGDADDLDHEQLLVTCVKLCAATADIVAKMERRLDWLAKELGYNGDNDGNPG